MKPVWVALGLSKAFFAGDVVLSNSMVFNSLYMERHALSITVIMNPFQTLAL